MECPYINLKSILLNYTTYFACFDHRVVYEGYFAIYGIGRGALEVMFLVGIDVIDPAMLHSGAK